MSKKIEALKEVLKSNPKNSNAWVQIGYFYFQEHEYEDAIEAYKKGIELNPNEAINWHNLGYIYYEI
ncbi:MAG: tetratricopeptide repeat protein, partial [Candidatus Odinarchaeota archaeon]